MDPFTERKIEIENKKTAILKSYPKLWDRMLLEFSTPDVIARGWMLYSANYLFNTARVRWAMDPLRMVQRIPNSPDLDVSPLEKLDYIILTHRHADHLDLELLRLLLNYPATWIIPEFLLDHLRIEGLLSNKIVTPRSMEPISMDGITLTPFEGFHWESSNPDQNGRRGIPSMGYMVEFNGKRWLFPGDTRTYNPDALTGFGPVDVLFAHLWLGKGCALQDTPELIEAFCLHCLSSNPKLINITHLEEFGRQPGDYWDTRHFVPIEDWFRKHNPEIKVKSAFMGETILL